MNKPKVKRWIHIVLLTIAVGACVYVTRGAWKTGDVAAAILSVAGTISAAFLALKTAFLPVVDKAVDELPDDAPRDPQKT